MRPRGFRKIYHRPDIRYFKPQGVPMRFLEVIELSEEEIEAMRLKNVEDLDQTDAAERMGTSQSTFQRILSSAYQKVSKALVTGKAIRIIKQEEE